MTQLAAVSRPAYAPSALFAVTVFASAGLVFLVQPMVAKLVLPLLGGSPSVWNTSMVFFQLALLAGYAYAHALQRISRARTQALIHGAALVAAALALPLRVNGLMGPPSSDHPNLWLLGVLALSIGAPFAVLSATAPLAQAWYARTVGQSEGKEPYVLYAASNLGSLLALLVYPLIVEPTLTLGGQRWGWSGGYIGFVLLMGMLALVVARAGSDTPQALAAPARTPPVAWRMRFAWIGLAAIPSSLMLGVTTHITTDVASAPFLWVAPLALYLLTFIIAFQEKPLITSPVTLGLQALTVAGCAVILPYKSAFFGLQFAVHLSAFFFTALMCHQALVARRPDPARLTEFYLCLSIGGVLGGAFNALAAPAIFDQVWEYPLVLALSCLARPWGDWKIPPFTWVMMVVGSLAALLTPLAVTFAEAHGSANQVVGSIDRSELYNMGVLALLILAAIAAFLIRSRGWMFFLMIVMVSVAAEAAADRTDSRDHWRSFFGVMRTSVTHVPALGGRVKMLAHGTTLHGAQAANPQYRCLPQVYYTPSSPIGQVFGALQARRSTVRIGAVGLGTGSVAAFTRPGDRLTFFEIDPLVVRISTDPANFSYTTECARGAIDYVIGDARLTLDKQPADTFDLLLIDAFSSDAVPAHLLTVEAVRGYLSRLKPDGVLVLHLSNRNLDLMRPAQAVAYRAGGNPLVQAYRPSQDGPGAWESAEDVLVAARSPQVLAPFAADSRWRPAKPFEARPWTDDYTNLASALYANLRDQWTWLP